MEKFPRLVINNYRPSLKRASDTVKIGLKKAVSSYRKLRPKKAGIPHRKMGLKTGEMDFRLAFPFKRKDTMDTLKIYRVSDAYIRFLHSRDHRVQFNKDARRPYVGVVFDFGGFQYFAPLESPKPNHANMKSGKHFLKLKNGEYGLIGFNNMIPVHKDALIEFDINSEPDEKYKRLLQRQIALCNRMKADVLNHAQMTYFDVVGGTNKFLIGISCDFKKLETACKSYRKDFKPNPKKYI